METIVFEVEFLDGRTYRIFCGSRSQKQQVIGTYKKIEHLCKEIRVITNGLHTTKQWLKIVYSLEDK